MTFIYGMSLETMYLFRKSKENYRVTEKKLSLIHILIRHYDVTGKECPKYYVDHPDAWEQMKADISAQITIDQGLMGIS